MANTITLSSLTPVIYAAKDIVARELTGAINSVMVNSSEVERAAYGDTVQSFRTAQPTLNETYTPSMTIPDGDDQTVAAETFALDKVANVKIPIKGETARKLDNSYGYDTVLRDMFAQALRVVVNTIERNLCVTLKNGSSRATGTAGTTPFASDFSVLPLLGKILKDNGAPEDGMRSVIFDTAAGAKIRTLATLNKVNEAGSDALLRQGELLNLQGFSLKESAGVGLHTKGTGTGYLLDNTSFAIGQTDLHIDTGTGTIVAGDILTFQNDGSSSLYVVKTGTPGDGDQDIVLNAPGLRAALANNATVTVGNNYTANIALHQSAAELAMRAPAQPYGGDAAVDRVTIGDPKTGLIFEVAEYKGYGMAMFDITVFYGSKVWKPDFVATLLG